MQLSLEKKEIHPASNVKWSLCFLATTIITTLTNAAFAHEPGIRFEALDNAAVGLDFIRAPGERLADLEALQTGSLEIPISMADVPFFPSRVFGFPGVAVLDHDNDGDLDLFVTNGPGAANSLFVNQLIPTGTIGFEDQATAAGVAAAEMEATGTCFGDLDNDGDPDLLVLGLSEPNRLFENRGNGLFEEVSASGLEGGPSASSSCALGDIDGDGLLDAFIGNIWDQSTHLAIFAEPFALNQPNELYRNEGGLRFADVSETSGIREFANLPPNVATITWAASMVDIDRDGDIDLIQADDQGAIPNARDGGLDRGFIQVFLNDGTGHFISRPIDLDEQSAGSWMGVGLGDLDCDGTIDILGSNFGDYGIPSFGMPYTLGDQSTRWFLGNGDGSFRQPDYGDLTASVFGWGNLVADLDLDGDQDMAYFGGLYVATTGVHDNPGTVLENEGCGDGFRLAPNALSFDYRREPVTGAAIGDLDRDHHPDIVTVAAFAAPASLPLLPSPASYGSPFDSVAAFLPLFFPTPAGLVWSGSSLEGGGISVELNQGSGRGVTIQTLGTVDIVHGGRTNRDGIGALVSFRPRHRDTVTMPIQGGSSHASQHAIEAYFGLGTRSSGTVEVLWPGGVRNRLYRVRNRETFRFPEIPCSFDDPSFTFPSYLVCVASSLGQLFHQDLISYRDARRLFSSSIWAFFEER